MGAPHDRTATTAVDVRELRGRLTRLAEIAAEVSGSADLATALARNAADAQLVGLSPFQVLRLQGLVDEAAVLAGRVGALSLAVEKAAPPGEASVKLRVTAAGGMRAGGVLARQGSMILVDELEATAATGAGLAPRVGAR